MGRSLETSIEKRKTIVKLAKNGLSSREIASIVEMNVSTVRRILKRHKDTGLVERKARSGRPRKSTQRENRHLKVLSLADRFKTARELHSQWETDSGVHLSRRSVRRRLLNAGLRRCVAVRKPFISQRNIKRRLDFAKAHWNWTTDDCD